MPLMEYVDFGQENNTLVRWLLIPCLLLIEDNALAHYG
ncbi:hypothetical protein THOB06_280038 [Vibrio rotiferianus]|nr:hypothetical protein THOG10_280038 [Vibrio rotiferianus]CAH1580478.1 hypothetical protein THOB06_280038 [Vibrio rotiferianus]